ncbi:MAG TPA: VUT family protein, partial [Sphaerochaeta sp.]|nr:VUT family protein [Sphaerochaeta sp.]
MQETTDLDRKEMFLFALYITSMVLVNTIGSKIITLLGARVSVGIFFMPVLFLVTDIVGEVKGHNHASLFVRMSILMLGLLFVMTGISVKLAPHPTWDLQEQYMQ